MYAIPWGSLGLLKVIYYLVGPPELKGQKIFQAHLPRMHQSIYKKYLHALNQVFQLLRKVPHPGKVQTFFSIEFSHFPGTLLYLIWTSISVSKFSLVLISTTVKIFKPSTCVKNVKIQANVNNLISNRECFECA